MNTKKLEYGEPWYICKYSVWSSCDDSKVYLDEGWADKENLERVIACINFCAGVPSDALKPLGLASSFRPLTPVGRETQVLEEQKELNALRDEIDKLRCEVAVKALVIESLRWQMFKIEQMVKDQIPFFVITHDTNKKNPVD